MRLQRLQLIRYGKFTDAEITLPKAAHDFHLIVGPNEAGKSTVRGAIADLLFGFQTRAAAMAFLHPQPELRLAAQVADGHDQLDFVRVKAAKNTLRRPDDAVVADDALAAYLGAADRGFFEKMFGLGHAQLVEGGQSILDASKDVSQVLFQSAAGIAGLGRVKDALIAEADKLWAPRHAGSRAYYAASDRFDAASRELKTTTVRTKSWADAREALDDIERRIAAAQDEKALLQASRVQLERVRRLAGPVQTLQARLVESAALGSVLELPADASAVVNSGATDLSVAETVLRQCTLAVEQATVHRDGPTVDTGLLAAKDDIESLAAFGESVRQHYADLPTRRAEVEQHLSLARAAAAELGWPADEPALRANLPAPLIVRDVQRLVTEHGRLWETRVAAANVASAKQEELAAAAHELNENAAGDVSALLRTAMADAQGHRNAADQQARLGLALATAERAVDVGLAALGRWRLEVPLLQRMSLPSAERVSAWVTKRQLLVSECGATTNRAGEAQRGLTNALLQVKQYAEARHIVTGAEVREARTGRDARWRAIKAGSTPLDAGAAALDAAMALADELADTKLGSATEAAALQSLRQQVERAETELEARRLASDRKAAELSALDQEWSALTDACGLAGLDLADAPAWMARREQALAAAAARDERAADWRQQVDAAQAATSVLAAQLVEAGLAVPAGCGLPALLLQAEARVSAVDAANARRAQLNRQLDAARSAVARLNGASDSAHRAYRDWETRWLGAIGSAALSGFVKTVAAAEQALARVEAVRQNLDKAEAIQRDRIDTMNRDLAQFDARAADLVELLKLGELEDAEPRQVVRALLPRLRDAEAGHSRRCAGEESLRVAQGKLGDAERHAALVHARLAPLLAAAGVETLAAAAPLVARSDMKRRLAVEIEQARAAILRGSDGLGLDAVVAEVASADVAQVAAALSSTADTLEQVQTDLTRLAEQRLQAVQAFQAIGGSNDAAGAESRRQEAMASMVDAPSVTSRSPLP